MPFVTPIAYVFLLPRPSAFSDPEADFERFEPASYTPLATTEDEDVDELLDSKLSPVSLTAADKWRLLKPMLLKYMLPLCESLHIITDAVLNDITISLRLSCKVS
jgi:battenin